MQFSNTTYRTGIVELLEDLTNTQSVSSGSYPLATKTRDINLAFDEYMALSIPASGTWQADDANHSKYPNATANIVAGQQDYVLTTDEQGNKIRDIYRVECKDANGVWQLLKPYNEMDEDESLSAQELLTGTPTRYYKTASGIFLDKTPSYNSTNGLRMFFSRTPNYFVTTDTTKEAGIPNDHHRYLALKPAYWYWLPKDSQRASLYANEITLLERRIQDFYSVRPMDERPRLVVKQESNK